MFDLICMFIVLGLVNVGRSVHYHRIPVPYWRDRLLRVRSMGLNTIEVRSPLCPTVCHRSACSATNAAYIVFPRSQHEWAQNRSNYLHAFAHMQYPASVCLLQLYIPWNYHERYPGEYTWDGMADVFSFIELIQELEMVVLLRVGPYICAEWDFGGLPWWLGSSQVCVDI